MSDEIVPDDKNWTWVLERSCGECGFDASSFDARKSEVVLRDLGLRWVKVLQRPDVRQRPRPGVWSPLEYGCHVRDVFLKFEERLTLMLAEENPRFENWDQDRTAVEDDYQSQVPNDVATELRHAAESLADCFGAVSSGQWVRRGFRSDGSVFTVDSIARYLMHDPVHHLWDVGVEIPKY